MAGENSKKPFNNYGEHQIKLAAAGYLFLAVVELSFCVALPFLTLPVGSFALANAINGIAVFTGFFIGASENYFDSFNWCAVFAKYFVYLAFGISLCVGLPFLAPVTAFLANLGVWSLAIKVGLVAYGALGILSMVAPRLPRNLWIYFKNGVLSLIPGVYKGSFGRAIDISRAEIKYRNENNTVEGFNIKMVIASPKVDSESLLRDNQNELD